MLHFFRWKVIAILAAVFAGVIGAPRINEPIPGGAGQISAHFTMEDAKGLAPVLRSGALPARFVYIDAAVEPIRNTQAKRSDS